MLPALKGPQSVLSGTILDDGSKETTSVRIEKIDHERVIQVTVRMQETDLAYHINPEILKMANESILDTGGRFKMSEKLAIIADLLSQIEDSRERNGVGAQSQKAEGDTARGIIS